MSCWKKKWAQFVFYSLETNFLMESNFTLVDGCIRQRKYFEENAFRAMTMSLVNIPLCVMTLLGNAAILTTIFKTPSLSTPAYILLAGLAFSDFTFGFIVQPLLLSIVLSAGYNHYLPPETFRLLCSSFNCSAIVWCGVSLGTSTAVALDRLLALRLHLRYAVIVTKYRVIVVLTCIWLFQGFLVPIYVWQVGTFGRFMAIKICVVIVVNFAIYFNIHLVVRHHQIRIQHQQPEQRAHTFIMRRLKKSAFNTFLVFIFLLICSLPFLYVYFNNGVSITVLYIARIMISLNASFNPFLYSWRLREIRSATKQIFCRS